jgi:hypothetical protein
LQFAATWCSKLPQCFHNPLQQGPEKVIEMPFIDKQNLVMVQLDMLQLEMDEMSILPSSYHSFIA